MNTGFEDRLRTELAAEQVLVPVDEHAVLTRGRASVRARRVGWTVLGVAILAVGIPMAALLARQPYVIAPLPSPTPSPNSSATVSMPAEILGSLTWRLSADTGAWAGTAPVITLAASGDRIQGNLGCGTYTGQIPQRGADWWVEARVATSHSCPYQTNARDNRYLEVLNAVTTFTRATDPDRLVLDGSGGTLVFEASDLDGPTWKVTALDGKPLQDSGMTLVIDGARVRGSAFCVGFTADLARNGTKWSVTNVRDVPGTALPCPREASDRMNRYLGLLEQADHAELAGSGLTLSGPKGTVSFTRE